MTLLCAVVPATTPAVRADYAKFAFIAIVIIVTAMDVRTVAMVVYVIATPLMAATVGCVMDAGLATVATAVAVIVMATTAMAAI
mgnify:CR=1 FL=1